MLARSVQPFWRLSDTDKQTDKPNFINIVIGNVIPKCCNRKKGELRTLFYFTFLLESRHRIHWTGWHGGLDLHTREYKDLTLFSKSIVTTLNCYGRWNYNEPVLVKFY